MKHYIKLLPILILTGCAAAINISPPQPSNANNTFIVDEGYDEAWLGVIDWFATNHITIDKLDKESGIVTAKHKLLVDNGELNCGIVKGTGTYRIRGESKTLMLNVVVRKQPDNKAKVQINLSGEIFVQGRNWDTGADISTGGPCSSTGKLEKTLATYL